MIMRPALRRFQQYDIGWERTLDIGLLGIFGAICRGFIQHIISALHYRVAGCFIPATTGVVITSNGL